MNCKQGDLAQIVKTIPEFDRYLGYVVTVEEPHAEIGCWYIDLEIYPGSRTFAEDASLRPIRPQRNDAVDEMVKIAGVPRKEAV